MPTIRIPFNNPCGSFALETVTSVQIVGERRYNGNPTSDNECNLDFSTQAGLTPLLRYEPVDVISFVQDTEAREWTAVVPNGQWASGYTWLLLLRIDTGTERYITLRAPEQMPGIDAGATLGGLEMIAEVPATLEAIGETGGSFAYIAEPWELDFITGIEIDGNAVLTVSPLGEVYVAHTNNQTTDLIHINKYTLTGDLDPSFTPYDVPFSEGYGWNMQIVATDVAVCLVVEGYGATILAADGTYIDEPSGPGGSYTAHRCASFGTGVAIAYVRSSSPRTQVYWFTVDSSSATMYQTRSFTPRMHDMVNIDATNFAYQLIASAGTNYTFGLMSDSVTADTGTSIVTTDLYARPMNDGYLYFLDGTGTTMLRQSPTDPDGLPDPTFAWVVNGDLDLSRMLGSVDGQLIVWDESFTAAGQMVDSTGAATTAFDLLPDMGDVANFQDNRLIPIPGTNNFIVRGPRDAMLSNVNYVRFVKLVRV